MGAEPPRVGITRKFYGTAITAPRLLNHLPDIERLAEDQGE